MLYSEIWYFDESDKRIKNKKACTFIGYINENVCPHG
jgi:hypothetical protein